MTDTEQFNTLAADADIPVSWLQHSDRHRQTCTVPLRTTLPKAVGSAHQPLPLLPHSASHSRKLVLPFVSCARRWAPQLGVLTLIPPSRPGHLTVTHCRLLNEREWMTCYRGSGELRLSRKENVLKEAQNLPEQSSDLSP